LQGSMIGPFLDKIERYPMGIVMETTPWKNQPLFFWKFVLREALHSASLGMFSDKSVVSFLERVQATKLRSGWLQCRRDYAVYLQEDGRVYVMYPSSFPFAKKDMYDVDGRGTFDHLLVMDKSSNPPPHRKPCCQPFPMNRNGGSGHGS